MKKFVVFVGVALLASIGIARAQYYTACGAGCVGTLTMSPGVSCCVTSSDDTYAASVAKWAVELQLRNWLPKKQEDLTRSDIKIAREKLDVLCKWAKEKVENKVFSQAYLNWASSMKNTLDSASTKLDHDEIATALLLHGLPSLPDGAK